MNATATYNGHLIGTVLDGGNVYQAVGGFNMFFDFAKPATRVNNVTSVESVGYAADGTGVTDGIYQATGAETSTLNRAVTFTGAFFGGGGDPVAETGGQFNIIDVGSEVPTYEASGIFAGAK